MELCSQYTIVTASSRVQQVNRFVCTTYVNAVMLFQRVVFLAVKGCVSALFINALDCDFDVLGTGDMGICASTASLTRS